MIFEFRLMSMSQELIQRTHQLPDHGCHKCAFITIFFVISGTYASVSLSRTVIDNKDLQWSAIGKIQCVTPGDRDPRSVDADLNYGVDYRSALITAHGH